jgi:hypothetical protein
MGHDSNPGAIAVDAATKFGGGVIWGANVTTGNSLANVGTGSAPILAASAAPSLGQANSAANGTWLGSVRNAFFVTVPEPSRASLLLMAASWLVLRRRREGVSG